MCEDLYSHVSTTQNSSIMVLIDKLTKLLPKNKFFTFCISVGLIFGYFGCQIVLASNSNLDLLVTMKAEKSTSVQVASSDWSNQRNGFYEGNGFKTIRFENVRITKEFILKPSFVPNNLVTVRSIEISKNGKILDTLDSFEISSIDPNVKIINLNPDLQLINPEGFAQLLVNFNIRQTLPNRYFAGIISIFKNYDFAAYLTIGLLFFIILGLSVAALRRLFIATFAQIILLGCLIYFLSKILLTEFSVSEIVGKGAFLGFNPKLYSQISVAIGFTYLLLLFKSVLKNKNRLSSSNKKNFCRYFSLLDVFLFFLSFIFYFPRINSANQIAKLGLKINGAPSWDLENIQSWDGLFREGWDPNVQFWYPYGSRIFLNQYPTWLECLNFLIFFFISLGVRVHLFPKIQNFALRIFAQLILFLTLISVVSDPIRLGLPILGVFAIASATSFSKSQIWIGTFWTLICILFGSDVFVYWLLSLIVFNVSQGLSTHTFRNRFDRKIAMFYMQYFLVILIVFLLSLINQFTRQIVSMALVSTKIGEASSDPVFPLSTSWVIWSSLLTLDCAVVWIMSRLNYFKFNGAVLSAIFATSILHLAKMGTRPVYWIFNFDTIILIATLCAMLWYQFAITNRVLQFCGAILVGVWLYFPTYYLNLSYDQPLTNLINELKGEFRSPQISTKNFDNFVNRQELKPFLKERFYVYGDSGYIYVLAGKKPYWQINLYNSTLRADQNRIISELKADNPKHVIIDESALNFDLVPHYLRTPLLLQYILNHYKVEERLNGQYWLLVPKSPTEFGLGSDLMKWKDIFGSKIDLGWIAAHYNGKGTYLHCTFKNNFCYSKLIDVGGTLIREINFTRKSNLFTVSLFVANSSDEFKIPQKYIWPLSEAKNFESYFDFEKLQETK